MFVIKHKERDYRNEDVWGYIGNISQASVKAIDTDVYLKMYNEKIPVPEGQDPCEYLNGVKLNDNTANLNKIFTIVANEINEELGTNVHCENLVFDYAENYEMPIYAVLLYIEDSKEFDNILLLTDQETYLMNDKGQTIERLV